MTITLTGGQLLESPFPEAPATEEVLTNTLRQRYAVGAYIPEVTVEGDLIHIHIDEAEVERMNSEYQHIMRLAERGKYEEAKKMITLVIGRGTGTSISISSSKYAVRTTTVFQPKSWRVFAVSNTRDAVCWHQSIVSVCFLPQDNAGTHDCIR